MSDLFPTPENVNNMSSAFTWTNNVTNGAFGFGIPAALFAIILIIGIIKKGQISKYFTSASFVYTLVSGIMVWGEWLNGWFFVAGVFLTALGSIWMRFDISS